MCDRRDSERGDESHTCGAHKSSHPPGVSERHHRGCPLSERAFYLFSRLLFSCKRGETTGQLLFADDAATKIADVGTNLDSRSRLRPRGVKLVSLSFFLRPRRCIWNSKLAVNCSCVYYVAGDAVDSREYCSTNVNFLALSYSLFFSPSNYFPRQNVFRRKCVTADFARSVGIGVRRPTRANPPFLTPRFDKMSRLKGEKLRF